MKSPKTIDAVTKNSKNSKRPRDYKNTLIIALSILLVGSGFLMWSLIRINQTNIDEFGNVFTRSFNASKDALGFSCGAFSEKEAESFLGGKTVKRSIAANSYFYGQKTSYGGEIGLTEGCYYDLEANNSFYATVRVETYTTPEVADISFKDYLSKNFSEHTEENYGGRRLIYNDQGYSLLDGRRVLTTSANKGNPSTHKQDSRALFEQVITKMPQQ